MTNKSAVTPGDNYTTRENDILGRFSSEGRMRYTDLEAGYCTACACVYNVECPRCHAKSGNHLSSDSRLFLVHHPLTTDRFQGQAWTLTECAKCSFTFRVLVQPLH